MISGSGSEAGIGPEQDVVSDVDAAEVIDRAVLVDEDIASDAQVSLTCRLEWRDHREAVIALCSPASLFEDESPPQLVGL